MAGEGEPAGVRASTADAVPSARSTWFAVAAVFWGYLAVRWLVNWGVLPVGEPGEPFVSPAGLGRLAEAYPGPVGGVFSFLEVAVESLPTVASGAWLTVVLTVVSILLGLVIAVPLSVARVYGGRVTAGVALAYTELIRGTPLLAQLFVLYFGLGLSSFIRELPGVGVGIVPAQAVWVAAIGFTINSSAYQSEYIRSALLSVESGQLTAARSVGLSQLAAIRYVVLPQGLRYAIPGWSNELVYLVKYSSLAAFITVPETYYRSQNIAADTFRFFELLVLAALLYLAMVLTASAVMGWVERRVAIPGLGQSEGRP